LHSPVHLHCPHTIARLLRDYYPIYDPPPGPSFDAPYNVGNGNIV